MKGIHTETTREGQGRVQSQRERHRIWDSCLYWALSVEFLGIPRLKPDWSIKTKNKSVLVNSAVSYIMDVNGGKHRSWEARETLYHKGH